MDSITPNPAKSPKPLAWLLVWLGAFLETSFLILTPMLAVHRPSPFGPLARPLDWHTPLLLSAVCASVLTGQGWYTQRSSRGRYKPKSAGDPATEKKARWIIGLILSGALLLTECQWVLGPAGAQVDWPLLLALNGGMAAGTVLLLWAFRLMPDPPGPDTDPLAPDATPPPKQSPPSELAHEVAYARRDSVVLPEALLFCITLVCVSAIVVLSFASAWLNLGLGRNGYSPLVAFLPVELLLGLLLTFAPWRKRRNSFSRSATSRSRDAFRPAEKETTSIYISILACGGMCAAVFGLHQNWPRLILLNAGAYIAYLVVRWTVTLPPQKLPTVITDATRVEWLPKNRVARATHTEIVLVASPAMRIFAGVMALLLAGMAGMGMVAAFAPRLIDPHPRYPMTLEGQLMAFIPSLLLFFFSLLGLQGTGPRELRLELDTRKYTQSSWRPMPGFSARSELVVPFQTQRVTGSMDADMAGMCLHEFRNQGETYFSLRLQWRDTKRLPQAFRVFTEAEEARAAMLAASEALGLPALGRSE